MLSKWAYSLKQKIIIIKIYSVKINSVKSTKEETNSTENIVYIFGAIAII